MGAFYKELGKKGPHGNFNPARGLLRKLSVLLVLLILRYVFERSGTYQDSFVHVKSLKEVLGKKFSKLSWPQFVDMLLKDELSQQPELKRVGGADARVGEDGRVGEVRTARDSRGKDSHVNTPDVWVTSHWAPYWLSCGLCHPALRPRHILHLEHLQEQGQEAGLLLERLGMKNLNVSYPHALKGQEGHSSEWERQYFGQLTKAQVWQLFELYRVDHELFGYSPRRYLDWAKT